jgi:hypothetical protein|tara:strand:- start:765 stop:2663 length:1899 start_codon:yes stop_codon:yes gene_type:complete
MAKNEVSIVIKARNLASKAIMGIRNEFKRLGRLGASIGRAIKTGLKVGIAAMTAVVAASAVVVKAFAEQEKAVNSLESAMSSLGDDVAKLLPKFTKLAAEIQDLTGIADESTIALMAQIRNLGVMPDQMEKATKGAIGLAKALGLDANAAARYTALALQGEFTILQRYVPALRQATSEAEKQAIVTDLMNRGFKQSQAELDTVSGRWRELKGRVGDLFEAFGEAISKGIDLRSTMASLSEKIKDLGNRMADGGISKLAAWLKDAKEQAEALIGILVDGDAKRGEALAAIGDVMKATLAVAAERAVSILKKAAKEIGRLIADGFKNEAARRGARAGFESVAKEQVSRQMVSELDPDETLFQRLKRLPAAIKEYRARVSEAADELQNMKNEAGGVADETKEMTANEKELAAAIKRVSDLTQDHRKGVVGLKGAMGDVGKLSEAEKAFAEDIVKFQKANKDAKEKGLRADLEIIKDRDAAAKKAHANRIAEINAQIAKAMDAANMAQEQFDKLKGRGLREAVGALREHRALGAFGETPQQAKDQEEINKLLKKEARRGLKLSPEAQEKLDAFRKQEADKAKAKAEALNEKAKADALKKELDALNAAAVARDNRKVTALENIEDDLKILLRAPGGF